MDSLYLCLCSIFGGVNMSVCDNCDLNGWKCYFCCAKIFLQDWHRLCECHDSCNNCPLTGICGSVNFFVPYSEHDIDKMIDIVSEWGVSQ